MKLENLPLSRSIRCHRLINNQKGLGISVIYSITQSRKTSLIHWVGFKIPSNQWSLLWKATNWDHMKFKSTTSQKHLRLETSIFITHKNYCKCHLSISLLRNRNNNQSQIHWFKMPKLFQPPHWEQWSKLLSLKGAKTTKVTMNLKGTSQSVTSLQIAKLCWEMIQSRCEQKGKTWSKVSNTIAK